MTNDTITKKEQAIRDTAATLMVQFDELNELNPVAAASVYKGIMQYFDERTPVRKDNMFTLDELEQHGELY